MKQGWDVDTLLAQPEQEQKPQPVGTALELFSLAVREKLDVRGSTKV